MAKHRSNVWKQMVRDRFLWVVGLTVSVAIAYSFAPVVRSFIAS